MRFVTLWLLLMVFFPQLNAEQATAEIAAEKPNSEGSAAKNLTATVSAPMSIKDKRKALKVLIKRKQYEQAYRLASDLLENFEGDTDFDFQYGLAAIETVHFDQALFAFERLVLNAPNQSRYRLELARTHFYLRNLEHAQLEFQRILNKKIPAEVRLNVQDFLDQIIKLQRSVEPKFSAVADVASGYDSNINSATDKTFLPNEELVFPVDIQLSDVSRETGSLYVSSLINGTYLRPISHTSSFDVRGFASTRFNTEISNYDLTTLMAEGGYGFFNKYTGPVKWRLAGRFQNVRLNSANFLNVSSFLTQGSFEHPSGIHLAGAINLAYSTFANNQDGDLYQLQVNASAASPVQRHAWLVSLMLGQDRADHSSNKFNAKRYQSLTLQSMNVWDHKRTYYGSINFTDTDYQAINELLYNSLRKDSGFNLALGWRYKLDRHVSLHNDFSWNNASSTLEANTFQRFKIELGVSYVF